MNCGQRMTCADRRRNMSPVRISEHPCCSQVPRRPCSAHWRNLRQPRHTHPRASSLAQTTLKKPSTIYEDPEIAGFEPRTTARPKSRSQQQGLCREWLMTFPGFLICFLVFFSVYWVYKYSWMQSHHARSDFSVNTTDKMMRSGVTNDDVQSSTITGSEDGTIDSGEGSGTEYGVSEGSDDQANISQVYDDGGTTENEANVEDIAIEVVITDSSIHDVRKDAGTSLSSLDRKRGESESKRFKYKGRKHGVGNNGDQISSSEHSHEEAETRKNISLNDIYEDIGSVEDDDRQVSDKAGAGPLGVIVELSGNEGERGVRHDFEGREVIGDHQGRGYQGSSVVGVDRKVGGGLGDSLGLGRGDRIVIDGNVAADLDIVVQVATGGSDSPSSEDPDRLSVSESKVKRGSKVNGWTRFLGVEKNKVGRLVSPKGGDSESVMEEGDDRWEGHFVDDDDSQHRSWEDGEQLARRQGSGNTTKAPAVEHCLSFGANWSKCWLKWSAAILAITALTIVIFCCMNIICWFIYLIILLVLLTFYVLKFFMKVI